MIKLIIIAIIFVIYSIAIFLCGRGYGNAENFDYIKNLKNENMMLKNDLSLKNLEDDELIGLPDLTKIVRRNVN